MKLSTLLTSAALLGASSLSQAAVLYSNDFDLGPFDNTTIIDPAGNGLINLGAISSVDSISITIAHTWTSDLTFAVTTSNGATFTLLSGVGGGGNLGAPTGTQVPTQTLADARTYTFVQSGGTETFGNGADHTPGSYDAVSWATAPVGGWEAGNWTIQLTDGVNGDQGFVGNITINGTAAVPEPSSTALLGLGGLALIMRRRK